MRRDLKALLALLLAAWIPLDSAVAGWWHHHRGAVVFMGGPMPPCGPPAPWAGWEHAVVIDDRPLVAPAPQVFVVTAPVAEVVHPSAPVVVGIPVHEEVIDAGYDTASVMIDACRCDANDVGVVSDGIPIVTDGWMTEGRSEATPAAAAGVAAGSREPVVETPTPAEAPLPAPPAEPPPSEPRPEPESAAPTDPPATVVDDQPPAAPADQDDDDVHEDADDTMDDSFETPVEDPRDEATPAEEPAPARGTARNLFDEAPDRAAEPADEAMSGDDPQPEAFEGPTGDDGFEFPADPPMDDASADVPADDMPAGDDGFEDPGDEGGPMEEGGFEETPADMPGDTETEEDPPAADPFDAGSLHTPGTPSRTWHDDTGRHSTEGRLVEIRARSVRILKATGRHTTVPLERLSDADRAHVAGLWKALTTWSDTAGLR